MPDIEAPKIEAEVRFKPVVAPPPVAQLPPMIVGPAYLLEKGFFAGQYDPAFGLQFELAGGPNLVFDSNYTKVYIAGTQKIKLPYTIYEGVAYLSGATANLIGFLGTAASGDVLNIIDPVNGGGKYTVVSVNGSIVTCQGLSFTTPMSGFVQLQIHEPQISGTTITINPRTNIITSNTIYLSTPSVNSTISYVSGLGTPDPDAAYIHINSMTNPGLVGATLPADFPVSGVSGNFYIITHPVSTASGSENNINGSVNIPYAGSLKGNTLVDYRFLRTNKGIFQVGTVDEITNIIGEPDPDNPLALGLKFALDNAQSVVYGVAVNSDDDAGYQAVQDFVRQYRVYSVVPLTLDSSTLLSYKSLIVQMNSIAVSKPRQLIVATDFLFNRTVYQEAYASVVSTAYRSTLLSYTDPYDLDIGDILEISDPLTATVRIVTVDAPNKQFTIDANLNLTANTQIKFKVLRAATKAEQANYWATSVYADRHVTCVLPDTIISNGIELPAFYAAAGLAGLDASEPPQRQFNGLAIAGVDRVKHSNFYFTDEQLNMIAGSGKLILIQDTPDSVPYIRNQLTTDVSSLLVRSRNIVKSIDTFILMATDAVRPLLRRYNVVAETLELIHLTLQGVISRAKNERVPGAGGIILDGKIVSLRRDPDALNAVIVELDLVFAVPLERIRIVLNVSA